MEYIMRLIPFSTKFRVWRQRRGNTMPHSWRDTDGRLRKGILALLLLILSDAVCTAAEEGWRLLTWAPALILLAGLIALASAAGDARQTRATSFH
jgi:hypothetical protein